MSAMQPTSTSDTPPPMNPGDDAPDGTPGTGENLCPDCDGTGQRAGAPCPMCAGSGKVNVGIGGA